MLRLKLYLKAAMLRTASSKLITLRNSGKPSELRTKACRAEASSLAGGQQGIYPTTAWQCRLVNELLIEGKKRPSKMDIRE